MGIRASSKAKSRCHPEGWRYTVVGYYFFDERA